MVFAPEGAKLYKSMDDTFDAMMRPLLDHVLNDVAKIRHSDPQGLHRRFGRLPASYPRTFRSC
jgi:hypothetical protein